MTCRYRFVSCLMALVISGLWQATRAPAAGPFFQTRPVFTAEQGGYGGYRIPCLVVTKSGKLLAFTEARKTRGDWAAIDILVRGSTDRGVTWSAPQMLSQVDGPVRKNPLAAAQKRGKPDEVTSNNPVPIVSRDGTIHLVFCQEYFRVFYRQSDDDGRTFTKAVEITDQLEPFRKHYDWQVVATGPGHGLQLKSGRLLVPVWLSTGTGGNAHHPSVVSTIYSDDQGRTWQCGEIVADETDPLKDPSEAMAVELADGQVLLNIRSEANANRRAVAISPDGATNWTRPKFDEALVEPICMASIVRVSTQSDGGKSRIAFANPDNLRRAKGAESPGAKRDRKNLSVRLSYDEGQTWPVSKTIEPGASAYSDLAVGPDGSIYCLYERSDSVDEKIGPPSLVLARFNLEWLTDGKDSLEKP